MNTFIKCFIGCVIGLLSGALLLCFEATKCMLPLSITLMVLSGIGVIVFGYIWLYMFLEEHDIDIYLI